MGNYLKVCGELRRNGVDTERPDVCGMTPLHWAVESGAKEATEWLLGHGANIEVRDNDGNTPWHSAIYGGSLAVFKTLFYKKQRRDNKPRITIGDRDNEQRTPLHLIYALGRDEMLQEIRQGMHWEWYQLTDRHGRGVLHYGGSCSQNTVDMLRIALEHVNLDIPDNQGVTPIVQLARLTLLNFLYAKAQNSLRRYCLRQLLSNAIVLSVFS